MVFLDCIQIAPQIDIFVRSGFIFLPGASGSTFWYASQYSYSWSSRSSATANAYYLQIEPSGVKPSNGPSNRYVAFTLRCLSTVLGM